MLFSFFLSFSVLYVPVHVHFLKLKVKEVKETGAKTVFGTEGEYSAGQ